MRSAYSDHKDFLIERQECVVGAPGHVTIYPLLVLPGFSGSTRISQFRKCRAEIFLLQLSEFRGKISVVLKDHEQICYYLTFSIT